MYLPAMMQPCWLLGQRQLSADAMGTADAHQGMARQPAMQMPSLGPRAPVPTAEPLASPSPPPASAS